MSSTSHGPVFTSTGEFSEAKQRLERILSELRGTSLTTANCKYNLAIIELKFDHQESERLLREALGLYEELGISKPNKIVAMGFGNPSEEWDYPPENWEELTIRQELTNITARLSSGFETGPPYFETESRPIAHLYDADEWQEPRTRDYRNKTTIERCVHSSQR